MAYHLLPAALVRIAFMLCFMAVCIIFLNPSRHLFFLAPEPVQVGRANLFQLALWNSFNARNSRKAYSSIGFVLGDRSSLITHVGRPSLALASDGSMSPAQLLVGISFEVEDGFVEELGSLSDSRALKRNRGSSAREISYRPCPSSMRDFISCQESFSGMSRACGSALESTPCVVVVPSTYARPFRWPQCSLQAATRNVPEVPLLKSVNADNWLKIEGKVIHFLPTGPNVASIADSYVERLLQLVPSLEFGKQTRLLLDLGVGTGSLSAALDKRGVLTLTITEKDSVENGIQLVLERGFPGLVQTLHAHRLPYPDQAFDVLHCGDCAIPWLDNGGLLFFEADRLVRAGGFIILMNTSSTEQYQMDIMRMTPTMCWELAVREESMMIWQKPLNKSCYLSRHPAVVQHACERSVPFKSAWNVTLTHCLVGAIKRFEATVESWPMRLTSPPTRLQVVATANIRTAKNEVFLADLNYWKYLTTTYLQGFGRSRTKDIRNVIDMNAGYGGFAAALTLNNSSKHWWVLNVVPISGPDRLSVIFDRGLLGVYHDWCKALDVYPRTFDMLHASALFSLEHGCNMNEIALEMDRLVRPGGFALIRDKKETIIQLQAVLKFLGWKITVDNTDSGPKGSDRLLHCQKSFQSLRTKNKR